MPEYMLKLKKASRQDKRRLANSAVEREAITKEARMKKQKRKKKSIHDDVAKKSKKHEK